MSFRVAFSVVLAVLLLSPRHFFVVSNPTEKEDWILRHVGLINGIYADLAFYPSIFVTSDRGALARLNLDTSELGTPPSPTKSLFGPTSLSEWRRIFDVTETILDLKGTTRELGVLTSQSLHIFDFNGNLHRKLLPNDSQRQTTLLVQNNSLTVRQCSREKMVKYLIEVDSSNSYNPKLVDSTDTLPFQHSPYEDGSNLTTPCPVPDSSASRIITGNYLVQFDSQTSTLISHTRIGMIPGPQFPLEAPSDENLKILDGKLDIVTWNSVVFDFAKNFTFRVDLKDCIFFALSFEQPVQIVAMNDTHYSIYDSVTWERIKSDRWTIGTGNLPLKVFPIERPGKSHVYLVQHIDWQLNVYSSNFSLIWSREETLASITNSIFIELPHSKVRSSSSLFGMLNAGFNRLFGHALSLNGFCDLDSSAFNDDFSRDAMGIKQLYLVSTQSGKFLALETITGRVVWQEMPIPNLRAKYLFPIRDPSANSILVASLGTVGTGTSEWHFCLLGVFNSTTSCFLLPYSVEQAFSEDIGPENDQLIFVIDTFQSAHVIYSARGKGATVTQGRPFYYFSARKSSGEIIGYVLKNFETKITWKLNLGAPIDAFARNIISTRSLGIVHRDRTVIPKYLNPHLFAITYTTKKPTMNNHIQNIWNFVLIDSINGIIVNHYTKPDCMSSPDPAFHHLVFHDHWAMATFYNIKKNKFMLLSTTMTKSAMNWTFTWSSFDRNKPPIIQNYIWNLPHPLTSMTDVCSLHSISNCNLLMSLPNGQILSYPIKFLTSQILKSKASIDTHIPLEPTSIINYFANIPHLSKITIGKTLLESTVLVVAHGIDLYCITYPLNGQSYDRLFKNHAFTTLLLVLALLASTCYFLALMIKKKQFHSLWK